MPVEPAAGVPIAFGTDAGVGPHGENRKESGDLVAYRKDPFADVSLLATPPDVVMKGGVVVAGGKVPGRRAGPGQ